MDIESLKLVLEAVQGVSGSAMTLAIIWMLEGYFEIIVGWGSVVWLVKILSRYIPNSSSESSLMELREMLKVGSAGHLTTSEVQEMKAQVASLIKHKETA